MLRAMGAEITWDEGGVRIEPARELEARDWQVPGDLSSAAFLVAAALLIPASEIRIAGVGVNPSRTGLLDVLRAMGGRVELHDERMQGGEPVAGIAVCASELRGVELDGEAALPAIDELPILAVVATQAHGETVVRDAAELRVKESDRIATTVRELRSLGAQIEARADGFVVCGPTPLRGGHVRSHGDHRLAMALVVAGLVARGESTVHGAECILDSFPGFVETLGSLQEAPR
jgi:3-phosphoshikimate 1-carboxyvinyltransferase